MSSYGRRSTGSGHMPQRRLHLEVSSRPTLIRAAFIFSIWTSFASNQAPEQRPVFLPRVLTGLPGRASLQLGAVVPREEGVDPRGERGVVFAGKEHVGLDDLGETAGVRGDDGTGEVEGGEGDSALRLDTVRRQDDVARRKVRGDLRVGDVAEVEADVAQSLRQLAVLTLRLPPRLPCHDQRDVGLEQAPRAECDVQSLERADVAEEER